MMTSGERRGLIVLTVVLALILVFVICRDRLFSPRAGISVESNTMIDSIRTSGDGDIMLMSADSVAMLDSVTSKSRRKTVRSDSKNKRRQTKSVGRNEPVTRDPLSEPVN